MTKCNNCTHDFETNPETEFQQAFRQWLRDMDYLKSAKKPWADIEAKWGRNLKANSKFWHRARRLRGKP